MSDVMSFVIFVILHLTSLLTSTNPTFVFPILLTPLASLTPAWLITSFKFHIDYFCTSTFFKVNFVRFLSFEA